MASRPAPEDDEISLTSSVSDQYPSDTEFIVDRVLAERGTTKATKQYLILWEDYPLEKATWEPLAGVSPDIVLAWNERLVRERTGVDPPFDLADFDARLKKVADGKVDRHRRREAKRKHLRQKKLEAMTEKEKEKGKGKAKQKQKHDSDSSSEAAEENEVEDAPGIKKKTKPRPRTGKALKDMKDPFRVSIQGDTFQIVDRGLASTGIDLISNQQQAAGGAAEIPLAAGVAPRPFQKPILKRQNSETSGNPISQARAGQARPGAYPEVLPSFRKSSSTSTTSKAKPEDNGDERQRASGFNRGGKTATRGGTNVFSNVFATREPAKPQRVGLLANAMDTSKAPKAFSNMRLVNKAKLQARDLRERAPDLSLIGGLFDPSKPLQPIKPSDFRQPIPKSPQNAGSPTGESPTNNISPFGGGPQAMKPPPAPAYRPFASSSNQQVCFFWDRAQKDPSKGPCQYGEQCDYLHTYRAGVMVAADPTVSKYTPTSSSPPQSNNDFLMDDAPNFSRDETPSLFVQQEPRQDPPRMEQPTSSYKHPICFFWDLEQKGMPGLSCKNGIGCNYQHVYEAGAPVADAPPGFHYRGPARKVSAEQRPESSRPEPARPEFATGRQTCFFWDLAQASSVNPPCKRGADCTYLHSHEKGVPVANPPSGFRLFGYGDTFSSEQAPESSKSSFTCFFWDNAQKSAFNDPCKNGADCLHLHEYRSGVPIDLPPPGFQFGPGRTVSADRSGDMPANDFDNKYSPRPEICTSDFDSHPSLQQSTASNERLSEAVRSDFDDYYPPNQPLLQFNTVAVPAATQSMNSGAPKVHSPKALETVSVKALSQAKSNTEALSPIPRPSWNPDRPSHAICHFYYYQRCTKGQSCVYIHSMDPSLPIAPSPHVCKNWLAGHCGRSDCRFTHVLPKTEFTYRTASIPTGDQAPREPIASALDKGPRVDKGAPRRKSVKFADEPIISTDEPKTVAFADQTASREPPTGPSPKNCVWDLKGNCRFGDRCRDVHQDDSRNTNEIPLEFSRMAIESTPRSPSSDAVISESHNDTVMTGTEALQPSVVRAEIPLRVASPDLAPPPPPILALKRKKINMNDYKRRKMLDLVGARSKEIAFGTDDSQTAVFDFGEAEPDTHVWNQTFTSMTKISFDQLCMAQDFKAQQDIVHRCTLWDGGVTAADPADTVALGLITKVVDELILRAAGMMATFVDFAILIFPARRDEWRFLEEYCKPTEATLRYMIVEHNLGTKTSNHATKLPIGEPYKKILMSKIHRLRPEKLLPIVDIPNYRHKFYLLFPPSESQTADFVAAWLLGSQPNAHIYHSRSRGSWDYFVQNCKGYGVVLIHESMASSIWKLPSLSRLIAFSGLVFWNISDSPYPMYPSNQYLREPDMGRIRATRLFPHGCAFMLTPSLLVADPGYTYEILKWFLLGSKAKYLASTSGTWKMITCHSFADYLLDLANAKVEEKEEFERLNASDPAREAKLNERGLSYSTCEMRYKLHNAFVAWEMKRTLSDLDTDSDDALDDAYNPIGYAPVSIDVNDEPRMIEWFAGWAQQRLDLYRKFVVVGTNSHSAPRATRIVEVPISKTNEMPAVRLPTFKPLAMASPEAAPVKTAVQKAQDVAAKFNSMSPKSPPASPKARERNLFNTTTPHPLTILTNLVKQASPPRTNDSDISMDLGSSPVTIRSFKHGIDAQQSDEVLKFVAHTGSSATEAKSCLAKAGNHFRRAVDLYKSEDIDSQVADLINSESNRQHARLPIAKADLQRANDFISPALSQPSILPPQMDGSTDDAFSPYFNGPNGRPISSASSRSGITTDENGLRFVPRTIRSDNSPRPERPVKPGYVPVEDREAYMNNRVRDGFPIYEPGHSRPHSDSQRARPAGSPEKEGQANKGTWETLDTDTDVETDTDMETEMLKETMTFKATSAWYKELDAKGRGWEHMKVMWNWEEVKKHLGIR